MKNAEIIELAKYQNTRTFISERKEFEKYVKLLSLHDLLNLSTQLTDNLLNVENLDEKLISRCKIVIQEINARMGGQISDLNIAFHRIFKNSVSRFDDLKAFQEI